MFHRINLSLFSYRVLFSSIESSRSMSPSKFSTKSSTFIGSIIHLPLTLPHLSREDWNCIFAFTTKSKNPDSIPPSWSLWNVRFQLSIKDENWILKPIANHTYLITSFNQTYCFLKFPSLWKRIVRSWIFFVLPSVIESNLLILDHSFRSPCQHLSIFM